MLLCQCPRLLLILSLNCDVSINPGLGVHTSDCVFHWVVAFPHRQSGATGRAERPVSSHELFGLTLSHLNIEASQVLLRSISTFSIETP